MPKADIHPKWYPEAKVYCNGEVVMTVGSTQPEIHIDVRQVNGEVEIIYKDNGKGIEWDLVDKIFTPFYTTSMGNNNIGLGLSIVYNLIVQLM